MTRIRKFLCETEAATAVEYAVMLAMILMACFATIAVLGTTTRDSWTNTNSQLNSHGFGS